MTFILAGNSQLAGFVPWRVQSPLALRLLRAVFLLFSSKALAMLRALRCRPTFAIPVLVLGASGCASTASVFVWQPAEAQITRIRRLAVLDFRRPENRGQIARSAPVAKFAENGFYELVDQG